MKIAVIMPVFRRVKMARNATQCFLLQELPDDCEATLFVVDDGETFTRLAFSPPPSHNVVLWSYLERFPTLAAKYNKAIHRILNFYQPDIFVLFDDDDIYFPWHLKANAELLRGKKKAWAKPSEIITDYDGDIRVGAILGHGGIAFTADVESRYDENAGFDFDARFMNSLHQECGPPLDTLTVHPKHSYLFRWHTGHYHSQWWMNRPGNAWYEEAGKHNPIAPRQELFPEFDDFTRKLFTDYGIIKAESEGE